METNDASEEKASATTTNTLLDQTRAIMGLEQSLTAKLERIEPWISNAPFHPHAPRVRPIPTNMTEALHILSVARTLSNRTSAPAGWNPAAPVVNFTTPNPLPHQLRGGALATLQLERAKEAESEKKRQKLEQQEKERQEQEPTTDKKSANNQTANDQTPPSAKRGVSAPKQQQPKHAHYRKSKPQQQQAISMNLSDSDSSSDDDDDDE